MSNTVGRYLIGTVEGWGGIRQLVLHRVMAGELMEESIVTFPDKVGLDSLLARLWQNTNNSCLGNNHPMAKAVKGNQ